MVHYLFISYNIIKKVSTECPNFVENSRMSRTTTANLQLFNRFGGVAARKLWIHNNIVQFLLTNPVKYITLLIFTATEVSRVLKSNQWLPKIMEQPLDAITVV